MAKCPHCGSENCYGMSRVVGYYSSISNWNGSKQAELRDRQKGNYSVPQIKGNYVVEEAGKIYKRGMNNGQHDDSQRDEGRQADQEAKADCKTV